MRLEVHPTMATWCDRGGASMTSCKRGLRCSRIHGTCPQPAAAQALDGAAHVGPPPAMAMGELLHMLVSKSTKPAMLTNNAQ